MKVSELMGVLGGFEGDEEVIISVDSSCWIVLGIGSVARGGLTADREDCLDTEGEDIEDYEEPYLHCFKGPRVAILHGVSLDEIEMKKKNPR
jgi:hypothetical protein